MTHRDLRAALAGWLLVAGCVDGTSVVGGATDAGSDAADVRGMDAPSVDVPDVPPVDVPDVPDVPFRCTTDASCAGNAGGAVCDVASGRCVECLPGADTCPAGSYCVGATSRCAPGCRNDDGCAPGVTGDAGAGGDGGAAAGRRCNVATRMCVACVTDDHCSSGTLCVGNACAPGCNATRACPSGQTCCGAACIDTAVNTSHCGACGTRCDLPSAVPACAAGACAVASCVAPYGDCDGNPANGCEVDTSNTVAHCGGCGLACAARAGSEASCASGSCAYACATGFADCDGNPANGCEVTLATSVTHCGACGNACTFANATATCVAGACALGPCTAGFADCDGNPANGCEVDTRVSVTHCGACGNACTFANATATCAGSVCAVGACAAGFGDCDRNPANGCEVDTSNTVAHCGGCGLACAARVGSVASCARGSCAYVCAAGFGDCDGNPANGCEVALGTSVTHCGACGTACRAPTGGSATCAGGSCGQSCPSGTSLCGSACVALTTMANCGACGRACTSGQTCSGGACVSSCPAGMVYIPAGSFLMGDADTLSAGARPPHMVTLSAYCMDLTEVTVAAYRGCTSCTAPTAGTTGNYGNWGVTGRDNHPVNYVDWNQARAYCQSRGGDLPTEAQWEYAARGTDGRIYPWGNTAPASQLCWNRFPSPGFTCPVQSYPSGNSPFGLFDMAGNVWEWTRDFYASYTSAAAIDPTGPTSGANRVFRGGAWSSTPATYVRAAFRGDFSPSFRVIDIGFRCARGAI